MDDLKRQKQKRIIADFEKRIANIDALLAATAPRDHRNKAVLREVK